MMINVSHGGWGVISNIIVSLSWVFANYLVISYCVPFILVRHNVERVYFKLKLACTVFGIIAAWMLLSVLLVLIKSMEPEPLIVVAMVLAAFNWWLTGQKYYDKLLGEVTERVRLEKDVDKPE